jgi:hypothetical protein
MPYLRAQDRPSQLSAASSVLRVAYIRHWRGRLQITICNYNILFSIMKYYNNNNNNIKIIISKKDRIRVYIIAHYNIL